MSTPNFALLREAAAIIDGIPDEHFNLNKIMVKAGGVAKPRGAPKGCGSLGCAIGWLGQHPKFRSLGLTTNARNGVKFKGETLSYDIAAARLFNLYQTEATRLFGPVWTAAPANHKEVFRTRVRYFLDSWGQRVNPNY